MSELSFYGPYSGTCGIYSTCHASCFAGYCKTEGGPRVKKNEGSNIGLKSHTLTLQDYQAMCDTDNITLTTLRIDRGWRRSGKFCYQPQNELLCCPQWTIRLKVDEYVPRSSHKRIRRRVERYLSGDWVPGQAQPDPMKHNDPVIDGLSPMLTSAFLSVVESGEFAQLIMPDLKLKKSARRGDREIYSSNACIQATAMMKKGGHEISLSQLTDAVLKHFSQLIRNYDGDIDWICGVHVNACNGWLNITGPFPSVHEEIAPPREKVQHNLRIETIEAVYRQDTYELFKKYQMSVHHEKEEDTKPEDYTRFLIRSPLIAEGQHTGSMHQLYWIDDVLVAVGVIDVLTSCTSSVYCFYDPDYSFLRLGTWVALKEIEWTQTLPVDYYYMGYYIHNNQKMLYKGQYEPSHLLCPVTMTLVPLNDGLRKRLDEDKCPNHGRLNQDESPEGSQDIMKALTSVKLRIGTDMDSPVVPLIALSQDNPMLFGWLQQVTTSLGADVTSRTIFRFRG